MTILISTLEQGAIFFPLVLGIYFSFKILNTTDLTIDGSYVLGAGSFARLISLGIDPFLSTLVAILAGLSAGITTAFIQKGNKINSLIAGILTLFMLYSINFQVMGRPNISVQPEDTLLGNLSFLGEHAESGLLLIVSVICFILLILLLKSKAGLLFRAFGNNPSLLQSIQIRPDTIKLLGLAFSNGLAALTGVVSAQINGFADINMGIGVTLTGIGSVIIGCELIKRISKNTSYNILIDCLGCFVGISLYFFILNTLLTLGIEPIHLKLVLGLILIFFLRLSAQSKTKKTGFSHAM